MTLALIEWDGKPVTQPGVYSNVPLDAYHSQEICDGHSVSSSSLRRVLERNGGSPAHFYHEWSGNPNCGESEDKPQLIFGRAVHHLLLGENFFSALFAIREKENPAWTTWMTKASKEWRDEIMAQGRSPLTLSDIEDIRGISRALRDSKTINPQYRHRDGTMRNYSMLNGHIEKSLFWKDNVTGLWCKARPDAIPTDSGDYADLKTTRSVAQDALRRTITDYAYHQQAAMVAEGSLHAAKIEMSSYTLVFTEKKPPYCVRAVPMAADDIMLGHQQNRVALDLIARCIKEKRWPGPGEDNITTIHLSKPYREAAKIDILENANTQESAA